MDRTCKVRLTVLMQSRRGLLRMAVQGNNRDQLLNDASTAGSFWDWFWHGGLMHVDLGRRGSR